MRTTLTESTNSESLAAAHRSIQSTSNGPNPESPSASTLIEFPSGRNVPEWRKRLSQRVREIQEQKAREAAEADAITRAAETVSCALPSGQLELVPEPEQAPLNPIVSKALERVERARRGEHQSTNPTAAAAAPALAAVPKQSEEIPLPLDAPLEPQNAEPAIETKPKLSIVNRLAVPEATPVSVDDIEAVAEKPKRVRVISESVENAALSYLETCMSVPVLASDTRGDVAGLTRRTFVGLLDLMVIALMVSPVVLGIQATSRDWSDPRMIGLVAGVAAAATLAYLTISIALTGRTLAMRALSVKAIDARTGLIPTGSQSIKRAFGYVFSLALLGLGFAFAFIDRDHRTLHDRFSRTIVVRN
jgi:uncharacterized RDD family membrane protein YckC